MRPARIWYRVKQFFRTLQAPLRPIDLDYAAAHLSADELTLFLNMPRAEQHHGIELCQALEAEAYRDPNLLTAALLHDVGKTVVEPRLWERVWVVLGEHFFPARAEAWSRSAPEGWRRGFVLRRCHPAWGAEMAKEAGTSPRVVELIRAHHTPPDNDEELVALQTLDEA